MNSLRGLIGVVHLRPTPGAPLGTAVDMAELLGAAAVDARAYVAGGIRDLVVENFHDAPFVKTGVSAGTIAALALALDRVRAVEGVQEVGVNVLRNDARAALGIAAATGAAFIRVNVHSGAMYTDQGLIEGRAAETMAERERFARSVRVFADVHVKHATPIAGEELADAARDAVFRGRADALVVSGRATGSAPSVERVREVRDAIGDAAPVFVGSGLDVGNAGGLRAAASGAIVGSSVKRDGDVGAPVDSARVRELVRAWTV